MQPFKLFALRFVLDLRGLGRSDKLGRMKKLLLLLLLVIAAGNGAAALETEEKPFPPLYVRKVSVGDVFTPFEFVDLDGKTWTNRPHIRKAMLILTGSWALRHDLRKWAEHISLRYLFAVDTIWVYNPGGTEFADHRQRIEDKFKDFKTAVPVVIDVHSLIGRSLRLDYDIPTIIGIDRFNRLAFCHESPFNRMGQDKLYALIRTRLLR